MGLERLRSHFPRETWMCVHSALRAADYGGALRAPFQQFRPTAGRHTANELTSVCHKSLLSHSATHRLVVRRRLIRYSQPHAWPHAKHTPHALGSHTQEGPGLRPCCQHGAFLLLRVSAGEQSMAAAVRRPMTAQARGPGIAPLDTACASSSTAAGPGLEVALAGSTCRCTEATHP